MILAAQATCHVPHGFGARFPGQGTKTAFEPPFRGGMGWNHRSQSFFWWRQSPRFPVSSGASDRLCCARGTWYDPRHIVTHREVQSGSFQAAQRLPRARRGRRASERFLDRLFWKKRFAESQGAFVWSASHASVVGLFSAAVDSVQCLLVLGGRRGRRVRCAASGFAGFFAAV